MSASCRVWCYHGYVCLSPMVDHLIVHQSTMTVWASVIESQEIVGSERVVDLTERLLPAVLPGINIVGSLNGVGCVHVPLLSVATWKSSITRDHCF